MPESLIQARRLLVRFGADVFLVGDEIPEVLDDASLQQAVQNEVGAAGVVVNDVTEWEEQP